MDEKFWLDRWTKKEIGFHRDCVQAALEQFWPRLQLPVSSTVLVPLCGMSADMAWLARQGHTVVGVELSDIAVKEFFNAQRLAPTIETTDGFTVFKSESYEVWCGNFLKLPPAILRRCNALYDRASLVALPEDMQIAYAQAITAHLGYPNTEPAPTAQNNTTQAEYLLIALEFDQDEMPGPPFSLPRERISRLYADAFDITCLERAPALDQNENLKSRGLTSLTETCYRLTRKA